MVNRSDIGRMIGGGLLHETVVLPIDGAKIILEPDGELPWGLPQRSCIRFTRWAPEDLINGARWLGFRRVNEISVWAVCCRSIRL